MSLTTWHRYQNSVRWRLTDKGVEVRGSGLERTPGEPLTITKIWEEHGDDINLASQEFGVPAVLILATTATESGGRTRAVREEPRYVSDEETPHQVSSGMMQTLISTAREALNDPSITREWLFTPLNSLRAGTAYIGHQKGSTEHDPPKVAAAYNAGGVYHRPQDSVRANRWQMRQYPLGTGEHVDRFVRWFNDAVAVLETHSKRPVVPYEVLLGEKAPPVAPPPKRKSAKVIIAPGVRLESDEAKAIVHTLHDAALEGVIPTTRITSSFRGNSSGFHGRSGTNGRGTAVDAAGPEPGLNTQDMADIFLALAVPKLPDGRYVANELIYAGPQIDFNIDRHRRRSKYAEDDHQNHVHCGVEKGVFMKWPTNSRRTTMFLAQFAASEKPTEDDYVHTCVCAGGLALHIDSALTLDWLKGQGVPEMPKEIQKVSRDFLDSHLVLWNAREAEGFWRRVAHFDQEGAKTSG